MAQQNTFDPKIFEGFNFHNMPNDAHGEANHDILEMAKETEAIVQNMPGPLSVYEAAINNEVKASFKDLTDSITKQINTELAPKRYSLETALKACFRAQEENDNPQVVADARMLIELAHLHRVHTDEKLASQTDIIHNFISDVEANHLAALHNVGAEILFNKLKAANNDVRNAIVRRYEIENERITGAMVAARRVTDNAFRGLAHCVVSFVYMQGREPYNDFIAFVNQLFKDYKRIYKSTSTTSPKPSTK